jgi:hypothetical protein
VELRNGGIFQQAQIRLLELPLYKALERQHCSGSLPFSERIDRDTTRPNLGGSEIPWVGCCPQRCPPQSVYAKGDNLTAA